MEQGKNKEKTGQDGGVRTCLMIFLTMQSTQADHPNQPDEVGGERQRERERSLASIGFWFWIHQKPFYCSGRLHFKVHPLHLPPNPHHHTSTIFHSLTHFAWFCGYDQSSSSCFSIGLPKFDPGTPSCTKQHHLGQPFLNWVAHFDPRNERIATQIQPDYV